MGAKHTALEKYFGYTSFLPHQEEVVDAVLARRDVLAVMATGGGKSLCYQLPALVFGGLTVVVSPLIALMKDQVDGLRANGIPAATINSSLGYGERQIIERVILEGACLVRILVGWAVGGDPRRPHPGPLRFAGKGRAAVLPLAHSKGRCPAHRHRRGALHIDVGA